MKKVIISLAAVIMLVGGIYYVVTLKPPKPTITIENNTVEVAQGSYCWNGLITSQCVDMISPPDIIKHQEFKPLIVSPGAELKIKFIQKPRENTLGASIWFNDEVENVPLNDSILLVPEE